MASETWRLLSGRSEVDESSMLPSAPALLGWSNEQFWRDRSNDAVIAAMFGAVITLVSCEPNYRNKYEVTNSPKDGAREMF